MKWIFRTGGLFIFTALAVLNTSSCNKMPDVPVVITSEITDITQVYAISGGTVTDDGGADITDSGICWSTDEEPTVGDNKISCCAGMGSYIIRIKPLIAGTKYYVRAYASNSEGTAYGNQFSFITSPVTAGGVITREVSSVGISIAYSGGLVYEQGGDPDVVKGVCWSTVKNPTVSDLKTVDLYNKYPPQSFSSYITGLSPVTKYYIRAYGSELSFTTLPYYPAEFNPAILYGTLTDIDGNIYRSVQIGTQTWMAENLKTTRLNDGTAIPIITSDTEWENSTSGSMCWYGNEPVPYKDLYGGYYNYYVVSTKKICPAGWHVPGKSEWLLLIQTLGTANNTGGKLKEAGPLHWFGPNTGATNESGFTGMPGSYRKNQFEEIGKIAKWWSSTSSNSNSSYYSDSYFLNHYSSAISSDTYTTNKYGLNIRCVKD